MADDIGAIGSGVQAQLKQLNQGAQRFASAAGAGGFGVSPEAGKAMITAIHSVLDGLEGARRDVTQITQDSKLGTSPDARVMTAFNKDVASGDNSAQSSISALSETMMQLEAGIKEAMRHYRNTDDDNAGGVTRAGK